MDVRGSFGSVVRLIFATLLTSLFLPPSAQAEEPLLSGDFVLALSWQPAFCETHESKPECRSQTSGPL